MNIETNITEPVHICKIKGSNFLTNGELSVIKALGYTDIYPVVERIIATSFMVKDPYHFDTWGICTDFSNQPIYYLHTEVCPKSISRMTERILAMTNNKRGRLIISHFKNDSLHLKLKSIERVLNLIQKPHFIIVDNILNFVDNVNDEIQANEVISFFQNIASVYDIPVLLVYRTLSKNKPTGILGGQIDLKCAARISIKSNINELNITSDFCRYYYGFETFTKQIS